MSNLPKNYEKILIGVAGVAALGLAAVGYLKSSAVTTDFAFASKGKGNNDPTIPEAIDTTKAASSLQSNQVFEQTLDKDRPVDLFVGVALYANKNDPNTPVDLDSPALPPLFPPIPNSWWSKTGADPSYANSPDRDDDSDGFSNKEEFEAKTNPKDANDVPALINKLAYVQDKSTMWYVQFGFESEGKWSPRFTGVTPDKKKLTNRVSAEAMLAVGDTFFASGEFAKRFKFVEMTNKEFTSERTKNTSTVQVAIYEDLKPNKKGTRYESRYGLPDAELEANAYYDRIAILDLKAQGNEGRHFEVEEGTKFSLPPGGAEKNYLLKKVTPESIEVEFTKDGTAQTLEIKKGGTP
ncbi:MAG: hypothetical protein JWO82_267 [Akkermansiaceae bacterium]|nr:hypothetical protein [Akkermansiaceae bacterium]